MLAEERMARIKERVNEQGSATLQELMEYLETLIKKTKIMEFTISKKGLEVMSLN